MRIQAESLPREARQIRTEQRLQEARLTSEARPRLNVGASQLFYARVLADMEAVRALGGRPDLDRLAPLAGEARAVLQACAAENPLQREYLDFFQEALRHGARAARQLQRFGPGEHSLANGDRLEIAGSSVITHKPDGTVRCVELQEKGASVLVPESRGPFAVRVDTTRSDGGRDTLVQAGSEVRRGDTAYRLCEGRPVCWQFPVARLNWGLLGWMAQDLRRPDVLDLTEGELLPGASNRQGVGLKRDDYPGRAQFTDPDLYPGFWGSVQSALERRDAPNFRRLGQRPIYGVGQPSEAGMGAIFRHLLGAGQERVVAWCNTRSEAVLYIDGQPCNMRVLAQNLNIPYREGASGEELDELEGRLREAILQRGSYPLGEEGGEQIREVPVGSARIETCRQFMQRVADENHVRLDYRRIPMDDERAPTPEQTARIASFTEEMHRLHPDAPIVFNCHQGRGRTTTAMTIAGMVEDGLADDGDPLHGVQGDADEYYNLRRAAAGHPENAEYQQREATVEMFNFYLIENCGRLDHPSFSEWMANPENRARLEGRARSPEPAAAGQVWQAAGR